MQEKTVTIINKLGLHARAAAKFVTTASSYSSNVDISRDGSITWHRSDYHDAGC